MGVPNERVSDLVLDELDEISNVLLGWRLGVVGEQAVCVVLVGLPDEANGDSQALEANVLVLWAEDLVGHQI